jgi:hypothetical protein
MLEVYDLPQSLAHSRIYHDLGIVEGLPFAASFNEDFVACFDLKGLFDYDSQLQFNDNDRVIRLNTPA